MKLFIHMGFGKTGTTSIQKTLLKNNKILKNNGIWYLGLVLENCKRKYNWQKSTVPIMSEFIKLKKEETINQILDVLNETIIEAKNKAIHTLVWSNEGLWGKKDEILEVVKRLRDKIDIYFIFYVRDYDAWMFSAYKQWGLSHKTYEGKLKSFKEIKNKFLPNFYNKIKFFQYEFPKNIIVRNMSDVKDVVEDFCNLLNIDFKKINKLRLNESNSNEELFLRALFNSKFDRKILPNEFNTVIGKKIDYKESPKYFLKKYFPTEEDIKDNFEKSKDDLKEINRLLINQGQKPLKEEISKIKEFNFDNEKLLMALSDLVIKQSIKIKELEKEIEELKKKI